jgi:hypothetical protein
VDKLNETGYDIVDLSSNLASSGPNMFTASATAGSTNLGFGIVLMSSNTIIYRSMLQLSFYSIPVARNKDFYGRQSAIDKINEFLLTPRDIDEDEVVKAKSFVICGHGGMGKTQTVAEYVHQCKGAKVFDAIFWVYADEPAKILDRIGQIALSLGLYYQTLQKPWIQ